MSLILARDKSSRGVADICRIALAFVKKERLEAFHVDVLEYSSICRYCDVKFPLTLPFFNKGAVSKIRKNKKKRKSVTVNQTIVSIHRSAVRSKDEVL